MAFTTAQRAFLRAGALLFLLGLAQGAFIQAFANPRMALSAHLTAVQSGMALMIAGIAWSAAALNAIPARIARLSIVIGMYGLWIGLTIAAATSASRGLPMAGAGHGAAAATEAFVSSLILASSALMTIGWALFVIGLIRRESA